MYEWYVCTSEYVYMYEWIYYVYEWVRTYPWVLTLGTYVCLGMYYVQVHTSGYICAYVIARMYRGGRGRGRGQQGMYVPTSGYVRTSDAIQVGMYTVGMYVHASKYEWVRKYEWARMMYVPTRGYIRIHSYIVLTCFNIFNKSEYCKSL
jgi:hypothetical protein